MTIGEKLKEARLAKGLKQSDVASKLGCAATSLTNWEKGKVNPSLEVLSSLCQIYEISALSLLSKKYRYEDLVAIADKPVPDRSYEEQVALNFSQPILSKLIAADAARRDAETNARTAAFLQNTNLLERFGGQMDKSEIDAVRNEYDAHGSADQDILFAFHSLNKEGKLAFLSMLSGMISDQDNLQPFSRMDVAKEYTLKKISEEKDALRKE
ncbi:MAG: helix-turn-helix domain-containing protein [Lachnospiraceae bacterium]|jgi:transcriptional regulator with XRE-family HTH domain|nr:helix-turn-helix domain-containing protein [Eubacterium sp.]MCH4000599.1 helix-turn-helix domain-containing protein [Lachnospiraceae bacterium]MCH4067302.1 helix-turn-helix domain-containing protein [Lachnospiraceae bacterium]MCH4113326.1 helix-turn-helix domain-containing protein [Lachnospiraceae bacterium]